MSGRIRSIKPEWLEDELLALASDAARVLSIGLLLLADDYGNGRANPVQLAGKVFPGKVLEHLASALEELRVAKFVLLYEVDGQRYFHIRNWSKHQRVDKPSGPRVPFPPAETLKKADEIAAPGVVAKVPELPAKTTETPANVLASRGSRSTPDPDPIPGPDPGPARDPKTIAAAALRDPMLTQIEFGNVETWPEVLAVCEAFAATYGRKDAPRHQGDPRARAILGRLAEGFSVAQLEAAVRGSKFTDYIGGNKGNQALVTILRDGSQIDKFGALTEKDVPKPRRQRGEPPDPRQPNRGFDPAENAEKL